MLQQRGHDQLVTITTGCIEQPATQFFDVPSFRRQDIGNVIRKDPSRHGEKGRLLKPRFYRDATRAPKNLLPAQCDSR